MNWITGLWDSFIGFWTISRIDLVVAEHDFSINTWQTVVVGLFMLLIAMTLFDFGRSWQNMKMKKEMNELASFRERCPMIGSWDEQLIARVLGYDHYDLRTADYGETWFAFENGVYLGLAEVVFPGLLGKRDRLLELDAWLDYATGRSHDLNALIREMAEHGLVVSFQEDLPFVPQIKDELSVVDVVGGSPRRGGDIASGREETDLAVPAISKERRRGEAAELEARPAEERRSVIELPDRSREAPAVAVGDTSGQGRTRK